MPRTPEAITEMWKRPALDTTTPKEVAERKHLFSGLGAVGIERSWHRAF